MLTGVANMQAVNYDLWIAGEQVTSENMNDLSVISGVTGSVKFNATNKTLTLDNAEISCEDQSGILSNIYYLGIIITGNNKISNNGGTNPTVSLVASSIVGGGKLDVINASADGKGILSRASTLTIKNSTVNVKAGSSAISGISDNTLSISDATVSAYATAEGSITNFQKVSLIGSRIYKPDGALFNATNKAICDTLGNIVKDTVKIIPFYNLKICGAYIDDVNKNDLSLIPGVTGKATYNPETKTLRFENASIVSKTLNCIRNEAIDSLTIEIVGTNNFIIDPTNGGYNSIVLRKNAFFTGTGTLNLKATKASAIWFYPPNSTDLVTYTVSGGCKLNCFSDSNSGIISSGYGGYGYNTKLVVNGSSITACSKHATNPSIRVSHLELNQCVIAEPAGAVFNSTEKAICYADGTIVKDTVKIQPIGTGVKIIGNQSVVLYPNPVQDVLHIKAEGAVNAVRVYNIHGAVVAQALNNAREINLSHLPTGIYMVRVEVGENVGAMRIIKN